MEDQQTIQRREKADKPTATTGGSEWLAGVKGDVVRANWTLQAYCGIELCKKDTDTHQVTAKEHRSYEGPRDKGVLTLSRMR